MNGEHKTILDAVHKIDNRLTAMEAVQEERHEQNKGDMNSIGELTRSVEKHCNEIGKLKVHKNIHWLIIAAIATALILA
jgi:two-component sensor histidine kinase